MAAPQTFQLYAPGQTPGWTTADRTGTQWTADANGVVNAVTFKALPDLLSAGCIMLTTEGENTSPTYLTDSGTAAHTLTAASMVGSDDVVLAMTGTLAGAANLTLPTAAALAAALAGAASQAVSYKLRIINNGAGAFAWTVVTNTGWTLNGVSFAIAQNTWREFIVTVAAGGASATLQSVGTGTWS